MHGISTRIQWKWSRNLMTILMTIFVTSNVTSYINLTRGSARNLALFFGEHGPSATTMKNSQRALCAQSRQICQNALCAWFRENPMKSKGISHQIQKYQIRSEIGKKSKEIEENRTIQNTETLISYITKFRGGLMY